MSRQHRQPPGSPSGRTPAPSASVPWKIQLACTRAGMHSATPASSTGLTPPLWPPAHSAGSPSWPSAACSWRTTMLGQPAVSTATSILTWGRGRGSREGSSSNRAPEVSSAGDCPLSVGSTAPTCPASVSTAAAQGRPAKSSHGCGGSRMMSRAQGTTCSMSSSGSTGSTSEGGGLDPPGLSEIKTGGMLRGATPAFCLCATSLIATELGQWEGCGPGNRVRGKDMESQNH